MKSQEPSADYFHPPVTQNRSASTRLPGPRIVGFWVLCSVGIFIVRRLEIDLAIVNIVTVVFALLALAALLMWWCFQSAFPPAIRWLPPALLVVIAAVIPIRYRLSRTTGSLVPELVRRGDGLPDERLGPVDTSAAKQGVDFTITTENDFPQFLGPDGNSQITHLRLDRDWQAHPPLQLWTREIGAGWSSFAAVNGFAVTMEQRGESELVTCYEVTTGEPQWSHAVETRHETVLGYVGPRSTPTIAAGRVYAMGATGIVRCLSAQGEAIWIRDLFGDYGMSQGDAEKAVAWGRSNSPLVFDGQVVVPIGGPRGGTNISLVSLDADNGETRWEAGNHQASYASPALLTLNGQSNIVIVNEGFITGHDPQTGDELWEHPWDGRSDMNANVSQPHRVDESHLFLSKGYGKGAELIELTPAGDTHWQAKVVWESRRVMKTKFSNVAIRDGYAYGLDDGILSCVDVQTGERQWKKGRYKYGQVLLVSDLLLVMSEEGKLALVEASPVEYKELALVQVLDGQSWNNMCLYGEYLLVRNSEQAACYRLKLSPL